MKNKNIYIVGAGLSGATIARLLAEQGAQVSIFEQRDHVAGNCHDERCPHTQVREHRYGPHIFHTNDEEVWQFVQRFARFMPYQHRVFTTSQGQVWNLPVNLHTLNQFRSAAMTPNEARKWLASMTISTPDGAENLQQHAHELMGPPFMRRFSVITPKSSGDVRLRSFRLLFSSAFHSGLTIQMAILIAVFRVCHRTGIPRWFNLCCNTPILRCRLTSL